MTYKMKPLACDPARLFDVDRSVAVTDPAILRFEAKVEIVADAALTQYYPHDWPAEVEMVRTDLRGAYCGATQFFVGQQGEQRYLASVYAVSDLTFLTLPAEEFAREFRGWFPMAGYRECRPPRHPPPRGRAPRPHRPRSPR